MFTIMTCKITKLGQILKPRLSSQDCYVPVKSPEYFDFTTLIHKIGSLSATTVP